MTGLGYNTAGLLALLRCKKAKDPHKRDGTMAAAEMEPAGASVFYLNEWLGAWLGQSWCGTIGNRGSSGDTPPAWRHFDDSLRRRRGDGALVSDQRPRLVPGTILISIARLEPDNNILPMVPGVFASPARRKPGLARPSMRAIPIMRPSRQRRAAK